MKLKDSILKSYEISKEKIETVIWAIKTALCLNWKMLFWWSFLSAGLAILPTVALYYNKAIINELTHYIDKSIGSLETLLPTVISLGIVEILIGVSNRLNFGLVYTMMYDSYYIGMQSILMTAVHKIDIMDLMKPEINDNYNFSINRAGSLTNAMSGLCITIGKFITVLSLTIVAFSYSKVIFIMIVFFVIFVLTIDIIFADKVRHNRNKVAEDERYAGYLESLPQSSGVAKEIRIYNMSHLFIKQWRKHYQTIIDDKRNRAFFIFQENLVSSLGYYVLNILLTLITMYMVYMEKLSLDEFLMIYLLGNNLYSAITSLTKALISLDYGLYALEKQRQFLQYVENYEKTHLQIELGENEDDEELVYHIINLKFFYNDKNGYVMDIPELKIRKGEIIALVGENGSGKTTLIKLLLGLYKPAEGVILFYGKPLNYYTTQEIREKAGVFFQDANLFHHTMQENVGYGDIRYLNNREKILQAIELGGASELLDKMPNDLNTLIGKKVDKNGVELSGGEKLKVAVSRAYMCEREIMILDEPAAMLDPIAEYNQFNNLCSHFVGHTVILISHRVGFARMSDNIILLEHGKIVESGNHDELIKKNGKYSQFFNEQAQWYEKTE